MTVYFDMDGVLADWVGGFQAKFGDSISYEEFCSLPSSLRDDYRLAIDSDENFYSGLKPNKEMIDLIHLLVDEGHDVQILSSVGDSHSDLISDQKIAWIREHVGHDIKVNLVNCSADKSAFAGGYKKNVLIDDRSKALVPFAKAGGYAIQYVMGQSCAKNTEQSLRYILSQLR